jgi:hypothetical protein
MAARSTHTRAASARRRRSHGRIRPARPRVADVSHVDGAETGYWDASKKDWVIDDSYKESVEEPCA